jgi:flagellar hook-associated protein 2
MATLAVGGLLSGLDTESLIQKLLAVERRPVTLLEARRLRFQAVATAFRDLGDRLQTLRDRALALADEGRFLARRAASSDETVVVASAAPGALRGSFALTVSALARGSLASGTPDRAVAGPDAAVAAGPGTFAFRVGAEEVSVSLDATTTLADLVAAINARGAPVRASAVNLGTAGSPAWTLALASTTTGSASTLTIVTDGTTLGIATTQTGADAQITVAGVGTFTRPTNTVADVLEGVTLTLRSPGTATLTLEVDPAAIRAQLQGLVDAYNDVVRTVDAQSRTSRNADGTLDAGAFSGDAVTRTLRLGLASVLATARPGRLRTLADLGLTTQRDGTLAWDAARLDRALREDPEGVRALIAGTATADGLADLLVRRLEAATAPLAGTIATRREALGRAMAALDRQIASAEDRLRRTEEALRARFTALEKTLARLEDTGAFLARQLQTLGISDAGRTRS